MTAHKFIEDGRRYYFPRYGEMGDEMERMRYLGETKFQFGEGHVFLSLIGCNLNYCKVILIDRSQKLITDGVSVVPVPSSDGQTHTILNTFPINKAREEDSGLKLLLDNLAEELG